MLGRKPGFMQRAEALRRDFHPRLGLGQATDVSDDRKVEAMGRLDAMLGRSLLDAPDVGEDEAPAPDLWRDDEPAASQIDLGSIRDPRPRFRATSGPM
jgi:hypothetical protein